MTKAKILPLERTKVMTSFAKKKYATIPARIDGKKDKEIKACYSACLDGGKRQLKRDHLTHHKVRKYIFYQFQILEYILRPTFSV